MTTYLLAGGGTAGHVNPLLSLADTIRARDKNATIVVLGTEEGLEARLVPDRGYELVTIDRLPFPRRPGRQAVGFAGKFRRAVREVARLIDERSVDVVVGFGGYAAAPAYLAARRQRVPLVVHEANAKPGLANRLGARYAEAVGTAFHGTKIRGGRYVGMPLRPEITQIDRETAAREALAYFELDADRPVLLVTGGSLGARRINNSVFAARQTIIDAGFQILHIAGNRSELVDPGEEHYFLLTYCDRMELALATARFAVSRAGAATVSELSALGIPAIYIPYPVGNGEQRFNAAEVVESGGALLVEDVAFTSSWVNDNLVPLLRDPAKIDDMAVRSRLMGSLGGAEKLLELVDEVLDSRDSSRA